MIAQKYRNPTVRSLGGGPNGGARKSSGTFHSSETSKSVYHGGKALATHDGKRSFSAGMFYPDGVFVKRMKASHVMRTPPGIAIQADVVRQLEQAGCTEIRAEIEGGQVLIASFADFLRHGFRLDRGFGPQVALTLNHWKDSKAARQLDFFAEVG